MQLSLYEQVARYQIEPELAQATPRRVRHTSWSLLVVATCCSTYLLILIASVFVAARSAEFWWLAARGRTAMARVTDRRLVGDSGSASALRSSSMPVASLVAEPNDALRVAYAFAPRPSDGTLSGVAVLPARGGSSAPVNADRQSSAEPMEVPVRYAWFIDGWVFSPVRDLSEEASGLSVLAALLMAIVATVVFLRWRRWYTALHLLLRYGATVVGTITDKEIIDGDTVRYFVTYGFLDPEDAPQLRRERCTPEQWRCLDIGQPVTILCLPPYASRSRLYAHLAVRCV